MGLAVGVGLALRGRRFRAAAFHGHGGRRARRVSRTWRTRGHHAPPRRCGPSPPPFMRAPAALRRGLRVVASNQGPRAPSPVWRGVAAAFAGWALIAAVAPFPLATLPTMLGRRLSRAFGAFSLLYAAAALALATADNKVSSRRRARGRGAHRVAVGAKLVVERNCLREFYPARSRVVASLAALGTRLLWRFSWPRAATGVGAVGSWGDLGASGRLLVSYTR